MKFYETSTQHFLTLALFLALVSSHSNFAIAEVVFKVEPGPLGVLINEKMFGDYGPLYVMTGKQPKRYHNEHSVAPREGLFSSSMRNLAGRIHTGVKQANYRNPEDPFMRLEQYNLAIRLPREGWTRLDPQKQGMNSQILLTKHNPEIVISLGAEKVGLKARESNRSMLADSQASMRSLPNGVIYSGYKKLSAPGISGYQYNSAATFDSGQELQFSIWVATNFGYNYSVTAFGDPRYQREINVALKEFVNRLSQIKPDKIAWSGPQPTKRR